MRILGIDPGIGITGYCILDSLEDEYNLITAGSVQTSKDAPTPKRLFEIFQDINTICNKYKPDCASVEQLFFFKNQKTIIPVAQARGVILTALEQNRVKIYEYTPMVVKQVLTGNGRADKNMVKLMVEKCVKIEKSIKLDDTTDAIAIAICHKRSEVINGG